MSRSDRATVLRIYSVGAVGAQVAPGRVVFEHRVEDHGQRAHAGGERVNTRVAQAASTDVGTTGHEILGAHSQHRFRSPHAQPSQRLAPFPSFRDSHPSIIPARPSIIPARPSIIPARPSVIPAKAGIHATAQPCDEPPSARRPTRGPSAPRVIGRRRALGAPLTPQIAWIPACAGMTEPAAPEPARTYKGARSSPTRYSNGSESAVPYSPMTRCGKSAAG